MCNYRAIAPSKKDYGIEVCMGVWGPATLICQNCSLAPDKAILGKLSEFKVVKDSEGRDYYLKPGCFTVAGSDWHGMARHVIEHTLCGEDIHPSVLVLLEEFYAQERFNREYRWQSRINGELYKRFTQEENMEIIQKAKPTDYDDGWKTFPKDPRSK